MPKLAIVDPVVSAGGMERFLQALVGGLRELPETARWEITLALSAVNSGGHSVGWARALESSGVRVHWLEKPGVNDFCRRPFNVFYFPWPYEMDCPDVNAPFITTVHDLNFKNEMSVGPEKKRLTERRMPRWLAAARGITVSSRAMLGEFGSAYPQWARKAQWIPVGAPEFDQVFGLQDPADAKRKFALPPRFLLSVGWIAPHKNFEVLFKALKILRRRGHFIPLVLVGPNSRELKQENRAKARWYPLKIWQLAERLGLKAGEDFLALGYVSDRELGCLYRLAEALVVPSAYGGDNFPMLEASGVGCPVVCSNIPALVDEAAVYFAFTFDPGDPEDLAGVLAKNIFQDPTGAKARTASIPQNIRSVYSMQKTASAYLSLFEEAMN